MKYTEVGEQDFPDYSNEEGECMFGLVTQEVEDSVFGKAVKDYIRRETGRGEYASVPRTLITTEERWSGYSEYTITDTWDSVVIGVPEWNWEREFETVAVFLKAIAGVEEPAQ